LIVRFGPRDIPRLDGVSLDVKSLLFTAALTAAATMLFGIAPALKLSRSGLAAGKRVIGRRGAARGRAILACSELALAVTLATGAALLVRSFVSVAGVDNGFDPRNIVTFSVALPSATYPDTAHVNVYYDEMVRRLAAIPGARAAGSVEPFALGGDGYSSSVAIDSGPDSKSGTDVRLIDAGYLRALRIPVIRGAGFDGREDISTEHVMLVNREAARRFWPNGDPIGSTVQLGASLGYEHLKGRVIGIVGDVRDGGPESEITPMIYVPVRQAGISIMTFVVRTGVPASAMIASVRREAAAVDRGVAIGDLSTLDRSLADSISRRRFQTVLLGAFAATALLLACIGVYGVVAESVMQRYHEIGIRMALGASPSSVFIRLMSNASTIVLASVAIGIVVAVLFRRVVSSMLFGVSATDPATLAAVAISVAVVSVIAAAVPARRATLVDPVVALRQE
jgi:putative ABC transport system permease protein